MGLAALAGCGGSGDATTGLPGEPVPGSELTAIVSNRTFAGLFDGVPYEEYYAPDGALRGRTNVENYTGSWEVVGDQVCFTYVINSGGPDVVDCYTVRRVGKDLYWINDEGENTGTAFIQEGNPKGL